MLEMKENSKIIYFFLFFLISKNVEEEKINEFIFSNIDTSFDKYHEIEKKCNAFISFKTYLLLYFLKS